MENHEASQEQFALLPKMVSLQKSTSVARVSTTVMKVLLVPMAVITATLANVNHFNSAMSPLHLSMLLGPARAVLTKCPVMMTELFSQFVLAIKKSMLSMLPMDYVIKETPLCTAII